MAPADGSDSGSELIYGVHAVREALAGGAGRVQRIMIVRAERRLADVFHLARRHHVPVQVRSRPVLDRLVRSGRHQGIIAVVASKGYVEPDAILTHAYQRQEPPLVLLLDEVQDPHNLGAVLRTAEAAGAHGVVLPERRTVGLTGAVAKASAGAVEHLRVARVTNLGRTIEWLKEQKLWIFALDPEADEPYTSLDLRGPIGLVLGTEGKGVRPGVLEKCDGRVSIPMQGRVASLNLSVAAAVVLYEVVRQRRFSRQDGRPSGHRSSRPE
jgi:23S rRNA (guanosine2251-2'-O)-methyltransferase